MYSIVQSLPKLNRNCDNFNLKFSYSLIIQDNDLLRIIIIILIYC